MNEPSGNGPVEWSRFYRPEGTTGTEVLPARYLSTVMPHIHDKWTVEAVDHGTAGFARDSHRGFSIASPRCGTECLDRGGRPVGEAAWPVSSGMGAGVALMAEVLAGDAACDLLKFR